VRLLNLARNFGEHNAVMAGLKEAAGDIAVIMDDDYQNSPQDVRLLVDAVTGSDNDVIYGVYERKQHHWLRNLGSRLNGVMATALLGKPRHLYLSSFKAVNRFVIDEIVRYDLPYPYVDGLIFRVTNRVGMATVRHLPRQVGRSGYTLSKLLQLWLNMFTNFSVVPLRVAMIIGMLTVVCGILFLLVALYWYLTEPDIPRGWASLVALISIFSGIQLLSIGMIGEYLGRLFLGHNRTPQYVVRERVGQ
jgi:undecaprenyl-phosphate 4-deoxy-4-formamido-L-arabinose transferase